VVTVGNRHDFETRILPHLDAAYNLARWLLRNDQNAEDAVQEAAIRALRYFDRLREGEARPWFLGARTLPVRAGPGRVRRGRLPEHDRHG
jgi:DNA-directed RNA polymerase specialized sigma24 family protein